ncbi:MAG TPA: hypothetical protein VHD60_03180, partial [Candidatus Saccharimonadales bacterium]|nr:hypothetical protein [Candidatus Saccharimonadales bacterium]
MRHKKDNTEADAESELEKRVDRMMDPRQDDTAKPAEPETDAAESDDAPAQSADTPPPIDIFKDAATAPDVPKAVLDEVGLNDESDKDGNDKGEGMAAEDPADDKNPNTDEPTTNDTPSEPVDDKSAEAGVPEVSTDGEPFSDAKTDAAVEDITKHDSDKLLEVEDAEKAKTAEAPKTKKTGGVGAFFATAFKKWWVWVIVVLALLGALYAVPFTRYHLAGLLVKQTYDVTVLDSTTHTTVSGATVTLDGKTATADAKGVAEFSVPVGHHQLKVTEKYYKDYSADALVPLWSKGSTTVNLVATGRQVPVTVINKITGQPIADATVRALDTKATTDKDGKAVIVLPVGKATQVGKVQADGYNTADVTVAVTAKIVGGNTFSITPSGRMYFLSNLSGNLDVVSTNLDGSNRLTVLAGTGSEDPNNTILMASRDW